MPATNIQPQCPGWLLDYSTCTNDEIRKFTQDRTKDEGPRRSERYNRSRMIARLCALDQNPKFSRFLDLPPELRLVVYEELLVRAIVGNPENRTHRIHTGVLRTSKLVYTEAEPVLYEKNQFIAKIEQSLPWNHHHSSSCHLLFFGPKAYGFWCNFMYQSCRLYLGEIMARRTTDILLGLRTLTVQLKLLPAEHAHMDWHHRVRTTIEIICVLLSASSNLKKLTFVGQVDKATIGSVFWPIAVLKTGVAVEFQGASAELEVSGPQSQRYIRSEDVERFGALIAGIRKSFKRKLERQVHPRSKWIHPIREMTPMDDVESILESLGPMGRLLGLEDLEGATDQWKELKDCADRIEAELQE